MHDVYQSLVPPNHCKEILPVSRFRWSQPAVLAVFLATLLMGCATQDRRLTEDERSCRGLGHSVGAPDFQHCMEELNQRRCGRGSPKSGQAHVITTDCSKVY